MRVIYERVAGLDVHKKTVVACRMRLTGDKRIVWEKQTFGTMTADLLKLSDWLSEWQVEQVTLPPALAGAPWSSYRGRATILSPIPMPPRSRKLQPFLFARIPRFAMGTLTG